MESFLWVECKPHRGMLRQITGWTCIHLGKASTFQSKGMMTNEERKAIADLITANVIGCTKEVLTSDEAAVYMCVSKSYLYKLTMRKQIPHYKPMGKMCYFNRAELEEWLQQNRCATDAELSQKAAGYCQRKGAAV